MTRRHRGAATIVATLAALALAAAGQVNPAAAADLSIGDPVLDLGFEGSITDASPLGHPTAFTGHLGTGTPQYEFVDGVAAGTKALKLGGDTSLDLGKSTALQPADLTSSFWYQAERGDVGRAGLHLEQAGVQQRRVVPHLGDQRTPLALSVGPATRPAVQGRASTRRAAASSRPGSGRTSRSPTTGDQGRRVLPQRRAADSTVKYAATAAAPPACSAPRARRSKTIGFNGPQYNGALPQRPLDDYHALRRRRDADGRRLPLRRRTTRRSTRRPSPRRRPDRCRSRARRRRLQRADDGGQRLDRRVVESSDPDVISPSGTARRPAVRRGRRAT